VQLLYVVILVVLGIFHNSLLSFKVGVFLVFDRKVFSQGSTDRPRGASVPCTSQQYDLLL
jgi:hypothetical protein